MQVQILPETLYLLTDNTDPVWWKVSYTRIIHD